MFRALPLLLVVLFASLAVGCETQAPFAECALDEEVTSKNICKGGEDSAGTTSCVVTSHPHCVESVCLSHFSSEPFCTKACSTDTDCVQGGFCWAFSETQSYCVPGDRKDIGVK